MSRGRPAVSVVIPTHNRADLLQACLDSVCAQTFTDWECVVVDDGSTDGTPVLLAERAAADPRIRWIRQDNSTASRARNRGVAEARAPLIAFLDSDDLYLPDRLQWMVEELHARPDVVLVYGDTLQFRDGHPEERFPYLGRIATKPDGEAYEALLSCPAIYAPVLRREVFERIGGFDETLESAEDWDAWLKVARAGPIAHRARPALLYRLHGGAKSKRTIANYRCAQRVLERHLQHVPAARRRLVRRRAYAFFRHGYPPQLLSLVGRLHERRDWSAAREVWRALVGLRPAWLMRPRVLANTLWAHLPTRRPPPWWTRRGGAVDGSRA